MSTHATAAAPFEVKATDVATRTFEGLSATWDEDLGGDTIQRGAFARTLDHWKASGGRRVIPLIDNHAYKLKASPSFRDIVGKMVDAREEDAGLWTRYSVARTPAGDDLLALASDGMVTGLSIGYMAIPGATERKGGKRIIKEVRLEEVSPVIFPMNPNAQIDALSVKALLDAARRGDLTDEQKAELRALLDDDEKPRPDAGASSSPAPAPEAIKALAERIDRLTARRLATRIGSVLDRGPARVGRTGESRHP